LLLNDFDLKPYCFKKILFEPIRVLNKGLIVRLSFHLFNSQSVHLSTFIFPSVHMSINLHSPLSVSPSFIFPSLNVCFYVSIYLSHLSVCPSLRLSVCLPVFLSVFPPIWQSICPFICALLCMFLLHSYFLLSVCLSICLFICTLLAFWLAVFPFHLSVHMSVPYVQESFRLFIYSTQLCLYVCPQVHLSVLYHKVWVSFFCLSVFPSVHFPICFSTHLSICLPIHLSVNLSAYRPIFPTILINFYLSILFICLTVCRSVYLSFFPSSFQHCSTSIF